MRQALAIAAGALLALVGAVVLGEYDLRGTTVLVGFPLYGIAVAELALAVGRRLAPVTLVALGTVVGAGLSWALWISFGHFRNDVDPPAISWVMAAAAAAAAPAWGWSGRRRHEDGPGATVAPPPGPESSSMTGPPP